MASVTELGYVVLGVSDLAAWKTFAAEVLGLELVEGDDPAGCYLRMDYWHHRVILREGAADDLEAMGWRVAGPRELEELQHQLQAAGTPFEVASAQEAGARHVLGLLRCRDPGENPLEIFYGPRIDTARPFYPGRPMHGPFVTGARGLGHVVIDQADPKAAEEFYARVLGMRGSIELQRRTPTKQLVLHFMSCNPRQHSLAFGKLGRGKRLSHLMTEHSMLEDVGLTRDRARRHKTPFRMEIGQHHNDGAVSFYVQTPSGWAWEIGWRVGEPSGQAEYGEHEVWGHEIVTPFA